VILRPYVENW